MPANAISSDTIVALATPRGTSAIAIVRVSGSLCRVLFRSMLSKSDFIPKTFYHCQYCSLSGELIDDIMCVFFSSPHSYTGEDGIEIYCHGNMLIVEKFLNDLVVRGCRLAEPGEFTKRAFLNDRLDLCQAEAVSDVIHASNEQALRIAHKQLTGSLSEKIHVIDRQLIDILSWLEKEIDFSDDVFEDDAGTRERVLCLLEVVMRTLNVLIDSNKFRSILDDGIRTMIVGAPNAGKSSLFNFLLDEERVIVSDIPGTTRDIVTERIIIGNHVLRLFDCAGLRESEMCDIERIGIAKTVSAAQRADLFLIVIDSNADGPPIFPEELIKLFNENNSLVIVNKTDLPRTWENELFLSHIERIEISIKSEPSAKRLKNKVKELIESNNKISCDVEVVTNARHADILRRVSDCLVAAKETLTYHHGFELVASDIRNGLEILGELTGGYDVENMLGNVFSNFCIGK